MVVSASENLAQGMLPLPISYFLGDKTLTAIFFDSELTTHTGSFPLLPRNIKLKTLNTLCPDPTKARPSQSHRADQWERIGEKSAREKRSEWILAHSSSSYSSWWGRSWRASFLGGV